jgi:arginine utilization regulatory protein
MPSDLQSKLLRAMQDNYVRRVGDTKKRPTTFRVVASCNVDPFKAIEAGDLRRDLFYRLSTVLIELVPLREREGDLNLLTRHFLNGINRRGASQALDLAPEVWDLFQSYSWPGNVRELEHVLEHAAMAVAGDVITLDSLPEYLVRAHPRAPGEPVAIGRRTRTSLQAEIERFERGLIEETLEVCGWNTSEAARKLGVPRQTLQYRMAKLGIRRRGFQ